ncbi:hypothetical protein JCM10212_001959 [Sporobolomyces blumeae]
MASATAAAAAPTPPRINATRPENLKSSNKRTSRQQLLALYSQLLPLAPPSYQAQPSYLERLLSHVPRLSLSNHQIEAAWDDLSGSVWVSDENDMQRLWRQGFFGKGFLSRSEPSWRRRVENRRAELEGREKRLTSEEITALRRQERKGTKLVKKLERDAEKLLAAQAGSTAAPSVAGGSERREGTELATVNEANAGSLEESEATAPAAAVGGAEGEPITSTEEGAREADEEAEEKEVPPEPWQLDAEHTQLQPEEAFFLLFSLGCLSLREAPSFPSDEPTSTTPRPRLSITSAFSLFLRSAHPPSPTTLEPSTRSVDPRLNRLDSPFLLSYAAYHHYRSMGWVARSGIKFCVDWVLYGPGGPVGSHAEFAVLIIPTYVDPADAISSPFRTTSHLSVSADPELRSALEEQQENEHLRGEGERRNSWKWFHTVNRVCSGVKKTLVLLHVVIPPQSSLPTSPDWVSQHPAQALAKLEMREVVVRRFLAGRMRD